MKQLKTLIEDISRIPLHEIVGSRVELRQKGREWCGICPNPEHDDHGLGSFNVNSDKSIAKCFACGYGFNNGISFISKFDKVSRYEAILRISLMSGLITENDYIRYSKERETGPTKRIQVDDNYRKINVSELASVDIRNLVYGVLTEGKKLEGSDSRLTPEHLEYLHNRGISDEEIEKFKYFSMPTRRAMKNINKKLKLWDDDLSNVLSGVPGFYFNKEKNFFTLYPVKGIGIPIRDDEGKIVAIQIRRDKVEKGGQRYCWWSTSFASDQLGASPGSPLDVVKPSIIKYNSLFITEGHFKAALLAEEFFTPVISVQGVGNWRSIKEQIGYFKGNTKYIFICYDADMAHNTAVMKQAILMAGEIKKNYPRIQVFFVVWNEDYGKGIDDMILAGHKKDLRKISLEEFAGIYCTYKTEVDKLEKDDENGRKKKFIELFLKKKN